MILLPIITTGLVILLSVATMAQKLEAGFLAASIYWVGTIIQLSLENFLLEKKDAQSGLPKFQNPPPPPEKKKHCNTCVYHPQTDNAGHPNC